MTDDELLASAFRKILNPGRYSYQSLGTPEDGALDYHLTLDDTYGVEDGITPEEFEAIRRAIKS